MTSPLTTPPPFLSVSHPPITFFLGISGPSSAGKTTLVHFLVRVFTLHIHHHFNHHHHLLILHGDDFCKEISLLPLHYGANGVSSYPDADGPASVDFEKLIETLDYIKAKEGSEFPEGFKSWQLDVFPDQEAGALKMVSGDLLRDLSESVSARLQAAAAETYSIVIVEGFLLYHLAEIRRRLDCRLFLRLSHEEARRRRLGRPSYGVKATKEGEFWKTEEYFEEVVWRNYVEMHGELFRGGDVEGKADGEVCGERGIAMQEEINGDMSRTLKWAVDVVVDGLLEKVSKVREKI